ncbi:MAG: thioesterase family protein [Pseudomonadota bacterium]
MKSTLQAGITHEFAYCVPETKTVPNLYPESPEFQHMPRVLATGFLVGLIEWTCIRAVNPHLDWPGEQTVGIGVNVTHTAPTPPGMVVTVRVKLEVVDGKKLTFSVMAEDERGTISEGSHDRFIIDAARFNEKVGQRLAARP